MGDTGLACLLSHKASLPRVRRLRGAWLSQVLWKRHGCCFSQRWLCRAVPFAQGVRRSSAGRPAPQETTLSKGHCKRVLSTVFRQHCFRRVWNLFEDKSKCFHVHIMKGKRTVGLIKRGIWGSLKGGHGIWEQSSNCAVHTNHRDLSQYRPGWAQDTSLTRSQAAPWAAKSREHTLNSELGSGEGSEGCWRCECWRVPAL